MPAGPGGKFDDDGLKLAYVLLDTEQFAKLPTTVCDAKTHANCLYPIESAGVVTSLAVCLPELKGHPCTPPPVNPQDPPAGYPQDADEAWLAYVDTFDMGDKQAAANGFKDAEAVRKNADLAPLKERDDFKKLVVELETKTKEKS